MWPEERMRWILKDTAEKTQPWHPTEYVVMHPVAWALSRACSTKVPGKVPGLPWAAALDNMTLMTLDAADSSGHVPVLGEQVVSLLDPQAGAVMLDCTAGRAGHGSLIVPRLSPGGRYIGLDMDADNVAFARGRLEQAAPGDVQVTVHHRNFVDAADVLGELGVAGDSGVPGVDLLLADLGFSSNQVADASRGFSFAEDGPLDMRLDRCSKRTAGDLVNTLEEWALADLIYQFGEERLSRRIARKIVEVRSAEPIDSTWRLAELVRQVYGAKRRAQRKRRHGGAPARRIDPATRTFMALRIAVNAELEALEQLLSQFESLLRPGARAAVISFHSLEDRLVKQAFAQWHRDERAQKLTRKVVMAGDEERQTNPRSRSARLRVIRWIG